MESYVVRVYRRDAKDSEKLAGLVELTDREEEKPFVSIAELWKILSSPREVTTGSKEISAKRDRGRRKASGKDEI
jgi:hypothetical protein